MPSRSTPSAAAQPAVSPQSTYARLIEQQFNVTYFLGCDSAGAEYKLIVDNSTSPYGTAAGGAVTANANTIVAGVYSAATTTGGLYVNGVLVGTSTFTAPTASSLPLAIMQAYANQGSFWHGYFAESIVYNRALSASEITRVNRYLAGRYGVVM